MKEPQTISKRVPLYFFAVLLFLCFGLVAYVWSSAYLKNALKPCNELDMYLKRSGCLRKMELQSFSKITNIPHIHNVSFSPNGEVLASGVGLSIRLWQVSDGKLLQDEMYSQDYGDVMPVFTPDGERLISGEGSKFISIWRVSDGQLLYRQQGHQARILGVDLTSDGNILATASDDEIKLWRVEDTQLHLLNTIVQNPGGYTTVTFSSDDTKLYSSFWNDHVLTTKVWQVSNGVLLNEYTLSGDSDLRAEFLPQKGLMAQGICLRRSDVVCDRSAVQLWRIEDGTLLDSFEVFDGDLGEMALSPDGKLLAISDFEGNIYFWQLKDKALIHKFRGHDIVATSMAFSPDGKVLASGGGNLILWNVPHY